MKKTLRARLPKGFSALKDDVGKTLRAARDESAEYGAMTAEEFAKCVGISRQTLSSIENGKRWPSYSTLERIMLLLSIEYDAIAFKEPSDRAPIPDYPDVCAVLGCALREGRIKRKLNLRQLSVLTGISVSQLSRIERGQFSRGKYVELKFFDGVKEIDDDTIVRFTHPELDALAASGGYDRDLGTRVYGP